MRLFSRINIIILSALLVLLVGCSNSVQSKDENEGQVEPIEETVEREQLEINHETVTFDEDNKLIIIDFSSNIPASTSVDSVMLLDESEVIVREVKDITIEEELSTVSFEVEANESKMLIDGQYRLSLTLSVNETTNEELLTDQSIAGSFSEMQEVYVDSDFVHLSANNEPGAYTIEITTRNTFYLPSELFAMEDESEVEEVEDNSQATENESTSEDSEYQLVSAQDIKQNYVDYMSSSIEVVGEVTQVITNDPYAMSDTAVSFLVNISEPNNYDADNSVWVEVLSGNPGITNGTVVSVQGTLLDTYTYDSVAAGKVTVPYIMGNISAK